MAFILFAALLVVAVFNGAAHAAHHAHEEGGCHFCLSGAAAFFLAAAALTVHYAAVRLATPGQAPLPRRHTWQRIPARAPPKHTFPH